jgi:2-keto-4-pentenoate hydratase/2-oxohepta-3-ene-1,7-dioic acid hydratase in catechol pathway
MRLVVYDSFRLGLVVDSKVADMEAATAAYLAAQGENRPKELAEAKVGHELGEFIRGGRDALATANKVQDFVRKNPDLRGVNGQKVTAKLSEVTIRPPVTQDYRFKVMCIGANFADHLIGMEHRKNIAEAREAALAQDQWGFYKLASNIVGTEYDVPYPKSTKHLDYEGEVALILSKAGKDIKASRLLDYVFGYTLFDDFSIRDGYLTQKQPGPARGGLMNGKNFDGSGALGPFVVTKDELPDPHDIDYSTKVNGEVRQTGNTKDMIRDFGNWLEYLTVDRVVNPGDIIASGTCAGTAADTSPRDKQNHFTSAKRFLKVGDVVEVSSRKIGASLRNRIVAN